MRFVLAAAASPIVVEVVRRGVRSVPYAVPVTRVTRPDNVGVVFSPGQPHHCYKTRSMAEGDALTEPATSAVLFTH